jgi:hypothetical protein
MKDYSLGRDLNLEPPSYGIWFLPIQLRHLASCALRLSPLRIEPNASQHMTSAGSEAHLPLGQKSIPVSSDVFTQSVLTIACISALISQRKWMRVRNKVGRCVQFLYGSYYDITSEEVGRLCIVKPNKLYNTNLDLKDFDDGTLIKILCFWALFILLFLSKTPSCFYFKTQRFRDWILSPSLDKTYSVGLNWYRYPCLWRETGTSSIN